MDKRFMLGFAYKNLMLHKSRAILTVLGVTVGIAAIVFLVAFAFGIEKLVTSEVTKGNAYKLIDVGTGNIQALRLGEETLNSMRGISQVRDAQPIINMGAKAKDQDRQTDVTFSGTSDKYLEWNGFERRWGDGLNDSKVVNPLVVNSKYVKFLGNDDIASYIGSSVNFDIIFPKEITAAEPKVLNDVKFQIVGILADGSSPAVYAKYDDLMKLGAKNFSQIKVEANTEDKAKIALIRTQIEGFGFKTQYVGDTVAQIEQIFQVFKIILGSFGLIALIVASLGMFNTLTISLLERTKEVALLKILGMRSKDISAIFLTEAMTIGILGGVIGVGLGYGIGLLANTAFNYFATRAGGETVVVFSFPVWFILAVLIFALLLGFVTGIYPARRATKIKALDVLRFE